MSGGESGNKASNGNSDDDNLCIIEKLDSVKQYELVDGPGFVEGEGSRGTHHQH